MATREQQPVPQPRTSESTSPPARPTEPPSTRPIDKLTREEIEGELVKLEAADRTSENMRRGADLHAALVARRRERKELTVRQLSKIAAQRLALAKRRSDDGGDHLHIMRTWRNALILNATDAGYVEKGPQGEQVDVLSYVRDFRIELPASLEAILRA